jgi:hypothetical protein
LFKKKSVPKELYSRVVQEIDELRSIPVDENRCEVESQPIPKSVQSTWACDQSLNCNTGIALVQDSFDEPLEVAEILNFLLSFKNSSKISGQPIGSNICRHGGKIGRVINLDYRWLQA